MQFLAACETPQLGTEVARSRSCQRASQRVHFSRPHCSLVTMEGPYPIASFSISNLRRLVCKIISWSVQAAEEPLHVFINQILPCAELTNSVLFGPSSANVISVKGLCMVYIACSVSGFVLKYIEGNYDTLYDLWTQFASYQCNDYNKHVTQPSQTLSNGDQ